MTTLTARAEAKQLIDTIPDDKITFVVRYIQSFAKTQKSAASVNVAKKAAYENLLINVHPVSGKELSFNGEEEVADSILKKYESLN